MSLTRTLARRAAVQAVYQWQLARDSLPEIERQFVEELQLTKSLYRRHANGLELSPAERDQLEELLEKFGRSQEAGEGEAEDETLEQRVSKCHVPDVQVGYFKELLHGVANNLPLLDAELAKFIDRPIEEVDPVERAILRIGCYEFLRRPETPYRVILNEAINLAKEFGATQSYRYVNGILDRVAHECRAVEMAARRRG
ncbi:transcription antitermination factor NusB [Methylococcus geothermalis]|uniref:Transcription antitermination protein NusB n=1 Tax=Methylococcus geothermalis TaxID=2681310 RepID=A0A858Q7M3_9GAMM|nr:transcription antitermination factor NusB [Methylococcus geothermalis]QJD29817.1 transcription antitermination factor NusB [Methylococcus geothermalis]